MSIMLIPDILVGEEVSKLIAFSPPKRYVYSSRPTGTKCTCVWSKSISSDYAYSYSRYKVSVGRKKFIKFTKFKRNI